MLAIYSANSVKLAIAPTRGNHNNRYSHKKSRGPKSAALLSEWLTPKSEAEVDPTKYRTSSVVDGWEGVSVAEWRT